MSYVLAFLGFVALIILHEFGHFAVAKAVGMRVERFSLFMGPLLVKFRRGETEYGIGPFPLGGYVRITGMNPHEEIPPEVVPRAYYNQAVWKRIVVILAGPAMNLLIAFVIVWALVMSSSQAVPTTTVGQVTSGSPAAKVLRPGDEVVSVDGIGGSEAAIRKQIDSHRCAGAQVNDCLAATPARVVVKRDGQLVTLQIRPRYNAAAERVLLGIAFAGKPANAAQAASITTSQLASVTGQTVSTVARIFEPQQRKQLHSIVYGYTATQESFATSTTQALWVLALISLSLAIINLFPFLPLDGGHVFWAVAEKLRGKRIPFEVMERAGVVGFVLIMFIFVIGLTNDISTLSGPGIGLR
ncbi:MAG: site-2 protease family protein [Solirubrobacterales bacterium]|nr:site-2 protease family protein [Solirubrobacterales bacterium]MBV9942649.1 site-2 protease family protein [Solirubrobacterales bacterium]